MEALPRETVVDALEGRLREDILNGRHEKGSYLPPERELSEGYGVTRTTLKHAFERLVQAGLLETRHGVGTRVRDYARLGGADLLPALIRHSPDWLREVFEVRRGIGSLIASRAAAKATVAQVAELRELLAAVREAEGGARAQLADIEVHRGLARATGNRVYVLLTNTLFNAYLPLRGALVAPFSDADAACERLRPVVEAVAAHDERAAHSAADAYLAATERIMLDELGAGR
ncbi:FadR/GntR family transcriptional regulator [Streptomyces antarcticus]|uniref:FadR/GntR family transcriptional regulator n=1 Tax=Streptomyces antarcticus TaxID=2996458 RepID=UPI00226E97EA|nr:MULTISPECIES: GntR family transcriptional regulator [unclassified Streptomyces]MCY0943838.1 GntR family transcriptional regulator [Streptomyces sp. H34-AA3]MCZ4085704.1 GntR family transcriptional regulator [Streptomyces sp. H34-S5]